MAKMEAIKKNKNSQAELVQEFKADKAINDMPNDVDPKEDDANYESEN